MRNSWGLRGREGEDEAGVEAGGSTPVGQWRLGGLSEVEVRGMPGVAVKCVDIGRNIGGESAVLGRY